MKINDHSCSCHTKWPQGEPCYVCEQIGCTYFEVGKTLRTEITKAEFEQMLNTKLSDDEWTLIIKRNRNEA